MKRFASYFFLVLILGLLGCEKPPTIPNLPIINSFSVSPASINIGQSATLSWSVTDASSIIITQGVGAVSATGSITITPEQDTTYTLTADNFAGSVKESCIIKVITPANVVMTYGPIYMAFPDIKKFSAKGTIKNTGTTTANYVRIYLYFYKKPSLGGGLYMEYDWEVYGAYGMNGNEEFEWRVDWEHDLDGWNMCGYVDVNNVQYNITWK